MRIRNKLLTLFVSFSIIPLILIILISLSSTQSILEDVLLDEVLFLVEAESRTIDASINSLSTQTLILRDLPPIQGIIRSKKNNGLDPLDGSTTDLWKSRLEVIFSEFLESDDNIFQIRFLDVNGKEIVRLDQDLAGNIETISETELQDKSDTIYFKDTSILEKDNIYVSDVNLNKEHGRIVEPFIPVVRTSTPIFDESGESFAGIIVINAYVGSILESIADDGIGENIVVDQEGFFLEDYGHGISFSRDDSIKRQTYFLEQPELFENLESLTNLIYHDQEDKEYRVWSKTTNHGGKYWILVKIISEEELFEPINTFRYSLLIVLFVSIILIGFFSIIISKSISNPLINLATVIDKITKGDFQAEIDKNLLDNKGEIGSLSRSLHRVITSMKLAILRTGLGKEDIGVMGGEINVSKREREISNKASRKNKVVKSSSSINSVKKDSDKKLTKLNKEPKLKQTKKELSTKNEKKYSLK